MALILVAIIIVGTSAWMAVDAHRLGYDPRDVKGSRGSRGWGQQAGSSRACFCGSSSSPITCLGVPSSGRRAFAERQPVRHHRQQNRSRKPSTKLFLGVFVGSVLVIGVVAVVPGLLEVVAPTLPECSSRT